MEMMYVKVAAILLSFLVVLVTHKLLKTKKNTSSSAITTAAENTSESAPSLNPSSSSTKSLPGGKYEVFLSFRGPDTRKDFTDFLYTYLDDAGIRTFRDDEELRKGEEIGPELLKAIMESKISIPVISKGYASSKWCLRELAKMVECKTSTGQKILPIFYDVEPSDVRHQTSKSFEEAFRQHEKNFDDKTVQEWREALRQVGSLKGWDSKKDCDGHQGSLVKMVFQTVLIELKSNYMLKTDELVGIDHHMEEMKRLLDVGSNCVRTVVIHGMGGIGKTTIAKRIYNQLSEHFEHCCFLEDVRETSQQQNGFVNLQSQLISRILKRKCLDIINADEGISMIKDIVCRKKVLVILDDVDRESQFEKVVGMPDWFALGSRIIVTTRDKGVLKVVKVDGTYEPPEMKPHHSLQLFSKHAFRMDFPPEHYTTLSREIVSTAGGLPLALKIFGSLLFGETKKEVWKETLKQLKDIPNEEVQEKLKISYKALNYEQQQIFLDIACLFIGVDKDIAFYMWDDCKFYPLSGINFLVLRSLIKIGDNNEFRMHDQLRDLGREIVRCEDIEEPGKRSRLWSHKDAVDILEERMGTEKVKALSLDFGLESQKVPCRTNEEFTNLSNLRFLQVNSVDLTGDFKNLFKKLRWLQWCECPGDFAPTNFCPKNLVILDLSRSNITNDWGGWSQIKMAEKLKVLNLSECVRLNRTPDLSTFASLERLILHGCRDMVDIDSSIGKLSSLTILTLSFTNISSLPTSIRGLSCLQTLDLSACRGLQRLPELPCSLTSLHVTCGFSNLLNLVNLQELVFCNCYKRMEVPEDIGKLSKLEILRFFRANISTLPAGICNLSRLREFSVDSCKNISCLPGLPSSLLTLGLWGCESLERLPDLSNLKILLELKLCCSKLREIQGLGKLESLESLCLYRCTSIERLPDLSSLGMLVRLKIANCQNLPKIEGLEALTSLKSLVLRYCTSIVTLPDLSSLGMLEKLEIVHCRSLPKIEGLEAFKSLKSLDMSHCMSIVTIPDLSNLGMLEQLVLNFNRSLREIRGLEVLKSLKELNVSDCIALERLPDLSSLKKLEELLINDCFKLTEIQGLEELKSLEILSLSGCISLERLPDLSNLKNLKKLQINDCVKLTEIWGFEELKSLKLFEMNGCVSIEKLPNLSSLECLEDLSMSGCEKLVEIPGLVDLKSLTLLDINGCKSIKIIPDLPNIKTIRDNLGLLGSSF